MVTAVQIVTTSTGAVADVVVTLLDAGVGFASVALETAGDEVLMIDHVPVIAEEVLVVLDAELLVLATDELPVLPPTYTLRQLG